VRPRQVLDRSTLVDGSSIELAREGDFYVIRVANLLLMSSAAHGSEEAMAGVAFDAIRGRRAPRVLIGGLGMCYTLRGALDTFDRDARITVAEILPQLVEHNRGVLAHLANHALSDERVTVFEGDVRIPLEEGGWDVVLMDVDNGPHAFTTRGNSALYGDIGVRRMADALTPGGALVVWSAYPSRAFERRLRRAGLDCEVRKVSARSAGGKGGSHFLFIATSRHGARRRRANTR
jgi:spermidine synthase